MRATAKTAPPEAYIEEVAPQVSADEAGNTDPLQSTVADNMICIVTVADNIDESPQIDERLLCCKCKQPVERSKAKLSGKQAQIVTCRPCNCKYVQLHGKFGTWPIDDFKQLPGEMRVDFYRGHTM